MERFLNNSHFVYIMKRLIFLLALTILLVACAETKVVKLGNEQPSQATKQTTTTNTTTSAPPVSGAAVDTKGKVPTKCDDPDLDDPEMIGKVTVTYSDGSTENFYDYCPAPPENPKAVNDLVVVEYICVGKEAKTKNHVCAKFKYCTMMNVKADPGKKVGACL
jgi:hypothetical protein